ncbi:MAG: helix-turn-helix domain-containing protein [bacterium]|uniref:Helix-turn-helix domain-containing protein n=1 Tax=Candidatus Methylomirabilis tolerans TaxID=3123416 RepID=A0AAJ1EJK2_9BACT|nr:helix-turn-helix domain-containing protein [Candidatus Methylomirabilis sp.]
MSRQIGSKRSPEAVQALLGKRLMALRAVRGLRQEAIEARGLNYKYLQRIEAGRCNLTLGTLQRIVLALELEVEDLFQFPPRVVPTPSGIPRGCWPRDGNDRQPRPGALKKLQIFIMEILDRKP